MPSTPSSAPTERPPRRRGWLILVAGVITIGLVTALLLSVIDRGTKSNGTMRGGVVAAGAPEVGAASPDFTLPALDGHGDVRLADFRGRPVIVNFWASWCNPCRDEFPVLQQALRDHRAKRLAVIGITYRDIPDDSRAFVSKMKATWKQATDEDRAAANAYGVRSVPLTFFVRPDGTIAARVFGVTSQAALSDPLAKLLAP